MQVGRKCSETLHRGLRKSLFSTKLQSVPFCGVSAYVLLFAAVIFQYCGGLNATKVKSRSPGTQRYSVGESVIIFRTHVFMVFRYIWHIYTQTKLNGEGAQIRDLMQEQYVN